MSAELYCMLNKSVDHLKKNLQDFTLMFSEPSVTSGFTVCVHSFLSFSQGPLRNTCGHFWLMIWEQCTKAVIMLNRVIEKGSVSTLQHLLINDFLSLLAHFLGFYVGRDISCNCSCCTQSIFCPLPVFLYLFLSGYIRILSTFTFSQMQHITGDYPRQTCSHMFKILHNGFNAGWCLGRQLQTAI